MAMPEKQNYTAGSKIPSATPEQTPISIRLEDETAKWSSALKTPTHIPLQCDLETIYADLLDGENILELPKREHSVFPGFTPYGTSEDNLLAYRCGSHKTIVTGSPEIRESETSGHIDFNCRVCKGTMYSEEVQTDFRA